MAWAWAYWYYNNIKCGTIELSDQLLLISIICKMQYGRGRSQVANYPKIWLPNHFNAKFHQPPYGAKSMPTYFFLHFCETNVQIIKILVYDIFHFDLT